MLGPSPRVVPFAFIAFALGCAGRPAASGVAPAELTSQPTAAEGVRVKLAPRGAWDAPVTVSFAVPLAVGVLRDAGRLRVTAGGRELPASRRGLAKYSDDSWRSVLVQVAVSPGVVELALEIGRPGLDAGPTRPVSELVGADGMPAVWALLPAEHLTRSGVAGPVAVPRASIANTALDGWSRLCDYVAWDTDTFVQRAAHREAWLYDRVTLMARGYALTGELAPLRAATREAELYRAGLVFDEQGALSALPIPEASKDPKYHYSQGMAMMYLLTGDERYREAVEAIALRMDTLVGDRPGFDGEGDFWTERHAGFALLAFEWAAIVSDDRAAHFAELADRVVDAALATQERYPPGYADTEARCFAHSAAAHDEPYGYDGCSPWMSAILADGLHSYAARVGGARAAAVHASLVKLGRKIARDGRDPKTGRPYYWMGVAAGKGEPDTYDEHLGESAYLVALAWYLDGKRDGALRRAADELLAGLRERGVVGQVRSFNWQCRTAVLTPALLR